MPRKNYRRFRGIRQRLLRWYDHYRRDLPWRRTRDPYAIWIAETMLQQTRVQVMIPYYQRFLRTIPTLEHLNRASLEWVLTLWSGLGYYQRPKNLKRATRIIFQKHQGKIPRKFEILRSLPGIGDYTAGALMSIAFHRPIPALDGNARRVLKRIFNIGKERELRECAELLVSRSRPGQFNQALMDLGATICRVRDPRCSQCPLAQVCIVRASGRIDARLTSPAKRTSQIIEWPLAIIRRDARILVRRRTGRGILNGLWEVPGGERKKRESLKASLLRHLGELGDRVNSSSLIGEIRHSITYRRIRAPLFLCNLSHSGELPLSQSEWRWLSTHRLHQYPLSSLSLKAVKILSAYESTSGSALLSQKRDGIPFGAKDQNIF